MVNKLPPFLQTIHFAFAKEVFIGYRHNKEDEEKIINASSLMNILWHHEPIPPK